MLTTVREVLIVAILGFVLICAGCVEMPPEDQNVGAVSSSGSPKVTIVPTETPDYMTSATPFSTPTPRQSTGSSKWLVQESVPDMSTEIYNESLKFKGNIIAKHYNLTSPPMTIRFEISPVMEDQVKTGKSQYGNKNDYSYKVKRPVAGAGFSVTLRDLDTGEVTDEAGYGGQFSSDKKQSLKILSSGNYHIEMTGNFVDADITIRVHKDNPEKE